MTYGTWRKHQTMLNDLERRLLDNEFYEHVYREVLFQDRRGKDGEIDLYATHSNSVFVFEVKSGVREKSYQKALQQLDRAGAHLLREEFYDEAFLFSYTGLNGLKYEGRKKVLGVATYRSSMVRRIESSISPSTKTTLNVARYSSSS